MVANFALPVGGIQESWNCSGERGGMIGNRELPGVGEKDSDDLAGEEPGCHKSAGQGFDMAPIFGVCEPAVAGRVNQRSAARNAATGFENDVINEATGRIGVELAAKHPERL